MAGLFDVILDVANRKGKNLLQGAQVDMTRNQAAKIGEELPFLADYYRTRNEDQAAGIPLKQAQTRHFDAETSLTPAKMAQLQALAGLQNAEAMFMPTRYDIERMNAETNRQKAMNPRNGITIGVDENGQQRIQIGGPARGTAGATYFNPETGEYTTSLTTPNQTAAQKSLSAITSIKSGLNDIVKDISPYLGFFGNLKRKGAHEISNLTGFTPKTYADYLSALTKTQIKIDQLMGSIQLPRIKESLELVKGILDPNKFSPGEYQAKIKGLQQALAEEEKKHKENLRKGINVNPQKSADAPTVPNSAPSLLPLEELQLEKQRRLAARGGQ